MGKEWEGFFLLEALLVEALLEECLVVDSWVVVSVGMEILALQEVMSVLVVAHHISTPSYCHGNM